DDMFDGYETGGMLEMWANLYGLTGDKEHLALIHRYDRRRLFDALIAGKDVLTNMHANTTIPEAQGAARAWEVTGEERYRQVAQAYWRLGVTDRGYYATGAQTNGEIWSPPGQLSARLGHMNQEHCTVYNMMRLAEYLAHWSGDVAYSDYWERNLYNGILAQQHPDTGMIAYYLPLSSGSIKRWGTPTDDFWCCHGTLVQAQTMFARSIYYEDQDGLVLSQYIPNRLAWKFAEANVTVNLVEDLQMGSMARPLSQAYHLTITSDRPVEFNLKLRLPWWMNGQAKIAINQQPQPINAGPSNWINLHRTWSTDSLTIRLPKGLSACPLPDDPDVVAFMDGPVVLAGILGAAPVSDSKDLVDEKMLVGDRQQPGSLLRPDDEREWNNWRTGYRTRGQAQNIRLIPLYEVRDERYQVYFPVLPG
ncbi:MAG TPA: beta-L-arabinofuranosidase domain-containing protein, partial [Anaerolineaceae bacterium]